MKTFKKAELKKEIVSKYGSVTKLKSHLKSIAKNPYGCYTSEVKIYDCKITYTSNPNCWASFLISIPGCGMSNQLALGAKSITKEGMKRGCSSYYISI